MKMNINDLIDFTNDEKKQMLSNNTLNNVQLFATNKISLEECLDNINKTIDSYLDITLDDILEVKLDKEFKDYENSLKKKSPEEILNSAYEYVCKEELKDEIWYSNLSEKEKAILIDQDNLLQELYNDWLDIDICLGESLIPSIEESIIALTRYYGKQNKSRLDDI